MPPKFYATLGICLKGSSWTMMSAALSQGSSVNLCPKTKTTPLFNLYHHHLGVSLPETKTLPLLNCLSPSLGVKSELHLVLSIQLLTKYTRLRSSWILTPTPIKYDFDITLWIFNIGLLVTPIQGEALLLGQVSCHRTGFLFFPLCLSSQDTSWPSSLQWWQLGLIKHKEWWSTMWLPNKEEREQLPGHMAQY